MGNNTDNKGVKGIVSVVFALCLGIVLIVFLYRGCDHSNNYGVKHDPFNRTSITNVERPANDTIDAVEERKEEINAESDSTNIANDTLVE